MKLRVLSLSALLLMTSCAMPLPAAGPGWVYTGTKEGVSVNNGVVANRQGVACGENFLGIASIGDSTMEAAKAKGGITNVATVNRDFFSLLGVYAKACTVVSGN